MNNSSIAQAPLWIGLQNLFSDITELLSTIVQALDTWQKLSWIFPPFNRSSKNFSVISQNFSQLYFKHLGPGTSLFELFHHSTSLNYRLLGKTINLLEGWSSSIKKKKLSIIRCASPAGQFLKNIKRRVFIYLDPGTFINSKDPVAEKLILSTSKSVQIFPTLSALPCK